MNTALVSNIHLFRRALRKSRLGTVALSCLFALVCASTLSAATRTLVLKSPTGVLTLRFALGASGAATYSVNRGAEPVLLTSRLGFEPDWKSGFTIASSARTQHRGSWKELYGERDMMPDNYNELTVKLAQGNGHGLTVQFRAYDGGVTLRYGAQGPMEVQKELTDFHWPASSFAYEEHGTEGVYDLNPVSQIAPLCQTPLTVTLADGTYAAILEAASVDFPEMTVGAEQGVDDTLIAELGGPGTLPAGGFTPWRLVMFAKTPGELLEHNYLELDLNAPQALTDVAWIKPGKIMNEVTFSTEGAHKVIDFAAAHHIQYLGFDCCYYNGEETGDATHERTVGEDGRPWPPLSIQDAVRYGKEHGVGVWVYIDHNVAERQRDILFPLYEKWGLAGVKIGFVNVGPQQDTSWITETIRKAAEHHLMLDIHDAYRTTGYTRTYPNLLTVEGIRGNEHWPTPEHDATIPFTRYLAGSADYTICYYSPPTQLKNTHGHQLAMSIISYSPAQWVFWYDQPSDYHGEPEISWFERLPTVWDETLVPLGEIGKYAVEARRSGTNWFVGAIGDSQGNNLHLPMKFLKAGVTYDATVYSDDPAVDTPTHIAVTLRKVTNTDTLDLALLPRGGEAIYLTPEI